MPKSGKPNTARLLESSDIEYSVREYEVDDALDAVTVAEKIGADPDRVFKTLVTRGDKTGIQVFCIPAREELNLKSAAGVTGNKRIEMVKPDQLLSLTGYVRGGCSPIAMKRPYPIHIDETAILFDTIFVSAGLRGMQLAVNAEDLADFIGAIFIDLVK